MVFLIRIILHVIPQVFLISPKKKEYNYIPKNLFSKQEKYEVKVKKK